MQPLVSLILERKGDLCSASRKQAPRIHLFPNLPIDESEERVDAFAPWFGPKLPKFAPPILDRLAVQSVGQWQPEHEENMPPNLSYEQAVNENGQWIHLPSRRGGMFFWTCYKLMLDDSLSVQCQLDLQQNFGNKRSFIGCKKRYRRIAVFSIL